MAKKAQTYRDILADIRRGEFAPVYILHGEEPYYIDLIADAIEQSAVSEEDADFNRTVFYGADSKVEVVAAAAQQFPVFADRRLVMLKESQSMFQAKTALDHLAAYVSKPNRSAVLVICFKGDSLNATSKLLKAAKESDAVVFSSPKIRDYQLAAPIKEYCQGKRIGIDEKAVEMLADHIGADLTALFTSIDKLIIAGGKGMTRITPDDIERNIGLSKEYNPFELTSAIAGKDYPKAMKIVEHFSLNPKASPTVVIYSQLFNYFQRLLLAQMNPDKTDAGLTAALKVTPYQLREVRKGMTNYSALGALNAIHALREADCRSKGIGSFTKEFDVLKETVFRLFAG